MAKKFGADVGYSSVKLVLGNNKGVYIKENAVIALGTSDGIAVAFGDEALALEERVPGSVSLIRPFSGEMTPEPCHITAFFSYLVKKYKLKNASLALSLSGAKDEETESVYVKATQKAGVGRVSIVDPVYAAAQGSGVKGVWDSAVINIGASVTDMGCFQGGVQAVFKSNSFAGNAFDRAIISDTVKNHRYRPSYQEAEKIKIALASLSGDGSGTYEANVMRPTLGLPKKLILTEKEVSASCESVFENLADEISDMVRGVKPEPDKVVLTGGSASLNGLASALSPLLFLPIEVSDEPQLAVIRGLEAILDNI